LIDFLFKVPISFIFNLALANYKGEHSVPSDELKVLGSLINFSIKFCNDNKIDIDRKVLKLPAEIDNDSWYDIGHFYSIIDYIKKERNLLAVENLGKDFFYHFKLGDELKGLNSVKDALFKMYNLYQRFIKAERIGVWKTEDITRHAHIVVKENTVIPSYFTAGLLYSLVKSFGRKAVKVKLVEKEENQSDKLNKYEISWMDEIKKFTQ
jgi:hypothetical protein